MKILYIIDALAIRGGTERIIIDKANYLAAHYSYEVHIVTANQGEHPVAYPLYPSVTHHDLGIRFHLQYQYGGMKRLIKSRQMSRLYEERLGAYIQSFQPDIIASVSENYNKSIFKKKGNIPLIFESHMSCRFRKFSTNSFIEHIKDYVYKKWLKQVSAIVALTDRDALEWKKINPHVCVIPDMVSLNPTPTYSFCEAKSIIFVGRFSTQKGIPSLLKIWELVNQRHPDWQLNMYAGYGDEDENLKSHIEEKGKGIVMHETTSDIFNKYKENSMLLLTSRFEPFGLVMPEAMSCGLPVVSFDCPYGPAEIITDGVDGFLIKNRDIHTFADKVCQLIENPPLRKEMGKQAIISSQRFSPEKIMPMWKQLFEELTSNSK